MATLVLGALGTALGGPLGGAIGALLGRQLDSQVIGSPRREGPRLKELAISTSSYGTPIPRHFGRMRSAGTLVWSTDLIESRETSGGGKGKPKTTSYSYRISFAVVLSSRAITGVGRIWADGNLLRGASGDLKTGGSLRVHNGYGDQMPDPLLAAALGTACPALRGRAYAVFEDLLLEDFGNRIPALSFEILADEGDSVALGPIVEPLGVVIEAGPELAGTTGFADEGGALSGALTQIAALYPLVCSGAESTPTLAAAGANAGNATSLPEAIVAGDDGETEGDTGSTRLRTGNEPGQALALRYYDVTRDFQPGLQRSEGPSSAASEAQIEFVGALIPDVARQLIRRADLRRYQRRERMSWRTAAIDIALMPGQIVRVPGVGGLWSVEQWEWNDRGVELELERFRPVEAGAAPGASGAPAIAADNLPGPSILRAFELPLLDGTAGARTYAALAGAEAGWRGSMLYRSLGSELAALGPSGRSSAVTGWLAEALPPSPALLLERGATVEIETAAPFMQYTPASEMQLAEGSNRLLAADEILQFAEAEQIGPTRWRLGGLLRGRGGSEHAALTGHAAGTPVTLLDDALVEIGSVLAPRSQIAAIGAGDDEPVFAAVENAGVAARPLVPVHPRVRMLADGSLDCRWTRRARGGWQWHDSVETPLGEERELYRIGIGDPDAPAAIFQVSEPRLVLASAMASANPGLAVWVCQLGQSARSLPLLLVRLP